MYVREPATGRYRVRRVRDTICKVVVRQPLEHLIEKTSVPFFKLSLRITIVHLNKRTLARQ